MGLIDELKEFGPSLIEAAGGFIIAALGGDGIQGLEGDPRLEVLLGVGQRLQLVIRGHQILITVVLAAFTLGIDGFGRESEARVLTGPVVVEVLGQGAASESIDVAGKAPGDVTVAEMLTDSGTVLGFDQGVIVGLASTGFGLLDSEFLQELGDSVIDVFRPVIAMEAPDGEGKGRDELLQNRQEKMLANPLHGTDHLELGDFIHCIDQVHALDPLQIALMHRVDPQVAGLAVRSGFAPFADETTHRSGFVDMTAPGSVGLMLAQVVQVAIGERGQSFKACIGEPVVHALTELPCGRP